MSVRVAEEPLLEAVSQVIQNHLDTVLDMEALIKRAKSGVRAPSQKQEIGCRIKQAKEQLERIARLRETLYDDYLDKLMNEHDYLYAKNRYAEQEEEEKVLLGELEEQESAAGETRTGEAPWLRTLLEFREKQTLTLELALELIERVVVHCKTDISVRLRFEDEYEHMKERLLLPTEEAANE